MTSVGTTGTVGHAISCWAAAANYIVGDQGELPRSLPSLFIPNVPLTWDTYRIIAPFALGVAVVGLLESLLLAHNLAVGTEPAPARVPCALRDRRHRIEAR